MKGQIVHPVLGQIGRAWHPGAASKPEGDRRRGIAATLSDAPIRPAGARLPKQAAAAAQGTGWPGRFAPGLLHAAQPFNGWDADVATSVLPQPGQRTGAALIAVFGAGAWGTALAIQADRAGRAVTLWARDAGFAARLATARENARYLPGVAIPASVRVTADAGLALQGARLALMVVPAQALGAVVGALPDRAAPMLLCCKGVEAATLRLPLEIVGALRPGLPAGVLSGPNFAHEVARGLPAAAVVATSDPALREAGLAMLSSATFRLYGGEDPVGAEVGGAAKNVIAIAAGAVIGAGLGENARAALVTRGLAELSRLALALGGRAETAAGLTGLGDLMLTCAGPGSRNMSLGLALGRGEALAAILAGRAGVTEGVATAPAIVARARQSGVELPICEAVADLLAGRITVPEAMARLLSRPQRVE